MNSGDVWHFDLFFRQGSKGPSGNGACRYRRRAGHPSRKRRLPRMEAPPGSEASSLPRRLGEGHVSPQRAVQPQAASGVIAMNIYTDLFLTFARIGCFTFGGGYAMIALMADACVDRKKWMTHDDMMDIIVIAESTPGPVSINCATFIGHRMGGMGGALAATCGAVLPSFLLIYLIASFLARFPEEGLFADAFRGIKIAVGVLILDAGIGMFRKTGRGLRSMAIMSCSFAAVAAANIFALPVSTVFVLLMAALAGLVLFALKKCRSRGREGR